MNIESSELAKLAEGWAPKLVEEAVRATQIAAVLDVVAGVVALAILIAACYIIVNKSKSWLDTCDDDLLVLTKLFATLVVTLLSACVAGVSLLSPSTYLALIDPQTVLVIKLLSL